MRHRWVIACAAAVLLPAAPAFAAPPASVTIVDPAGDNDAGLDEPPTDLLSVRVIWDGVTLTLAVTVAERPLRSLTVLASESQDLRGRRRCLTGAAETLVIEADETTARLSATQLDDELTASAAWSGTTAMFAFSSSALTDALSEPDPFACLSGSARGDRFFGAFDGKLLRIDPEAAVDALAALLSRRYGARFDGAGRRWLACPQQQVSAETRGFYAAIVCRFEFRAPGAFHGGTVTFTLESGVLVPGRIDARRYGKRPRRCALPAARDGLPRRLRLTGRALRASPSMAGCRVLTGRVGLARSLESRAIRRYPSRPPRRLAVAYETPATVGFGELFRFECRMLSGGGPHRFTCRNELGDRFVYRFAVEQKPAPRPPPSDGGGGGGGGGCDPSYAGACLDPNASDYDCAGGSGDGPLYVQGPITVIGDDHYGLDSDGDGVACES